MRVLHVYILISKILMQLIAVLWALSLIDKNIFLKGEIRIHCLTSKEIVNRNRVLNEIEIKWDWWGSALYLRPPSKNHVRFQTDAFLHQGHGCRIT